MIVNLTGLPGLFAHKKNLSIHWKFGRRKNAAGTQIITLKFSQMMTTMMMMMITITIMVTITVMSRMIIVMSQMIIVMSQMITVMSRMIIVMEKMMVGQLYLGVMMTVSGTLETN